MIEAKVMIEEYFGYYKVRGHYETQPDGSKEWIVESKEWVDGIITNLANEAQRVKERTGLGKRFMDRTFANFDKRRDKTAFEQCWAYANDTELFSKKRNGLIISGYVGSGKTHLSASIANDFAEKNIPTLFGTFIEHLEQIRAEFESAGANDYLQDMKSAMVLVIDDLGKEKRSEWTQQVLFEVVNYRYEHQLPIIITSNFTDSELANYVGQPIFSRLSEMCSSVRTNGGDYRMEQNNG
jgi:DNA replication protein DnaC